MLPRRKGNQLQVLLEIRKEGNTRQCLHSPDARSSALAQPHHLCKTYRVQHYMYDKYGLACPSAHHSVRCLALVDHGGCGGDEVEVVLALETLLHNLHVQQTEEATPAK